MNMAKTMVLQSEYDKLVEENARLREQLRWFSVCEKMPNNNMLIVGEFQHDDMGMTFSGVTYLVCGRAFHMLKVGGGLQPILDSYHLVRWRYIPEPPQEEGEK